MEVAASSLEIQLDTSQKILDMSKGISNMAVVEEEINKVSTRTRDILQLIQTLHGNSDVIEDLSKDVKTLAIRSRGEFSNPKKGATLTSGVAHRV